jgi:hypothetical protein
MDKINRLNNNMKTCILSLLTIILVTGCTSPEEKLFPEAFTVSVKNTLSSGRRDAMVFIPAKDLRQDFNSRAFLVMDDGKEVASQFNTTDTDYHGIVLVLDSLAPGETRTLTVRYAKTGEVPRPYTRRTQAELSHKVGGVWKDREYIGGTFQNVDYLRVPPEHKDHSWFIRYEGPGWESDKVGYRFYLDQRNAVDVFGKTTTDVVLQLAGQDGFDSYHELQPWGMDVLKVAKSLGVGSIAYLDTAAVRIEKTDSVTCRIAENGVVYASVLTQYYGWDTGHGKTDLTSRLSIHGGTRATHHRITLNDSIDNLCTGLIRDAKAGLWKSAGDDTHYGYLATYGKQSLNNDNLGIAILFRARDGVEFTQDAYSHIVKLKPVQGNVDYFFLAAWEGEPNGIKTEEQFIQYLNQLTTELANPLDVRVNP